MSVPATTASSAHPSVQEFFDSSWTAYTAILDHNYMHHREIFSAVRDCLLSRRAGRPFSFVDLGCGDARFSADALSGTAVSRYVGYDISAVALSEAGTRLAALGCPVELRFGDMLDALRSGDETFDVVFSSFAVHHLEPAAKAEFFRLAERRVVAGGWVVMIDVMREEGEDRAAYLERYVGRARRHWTNLIPEELAAVCGHIADRDFPEVPSRLARMAEEAGFRAMIELPAYCDHHTLIWQNPAD